MDKTLEDRFWSKVQKGPPNDCWIWIGARKDTGYGTIRADGKTRSAPQVSWELANGKPWPKGMDSCHTCDNRPCVNPAHIWPGTRYDNMRDMAAKARTGGTAREHAAKTHCRHGHPFTGDNLRVSQRRDRVERVCRTCCIERREQRKAARSAA